MAASSVIYGRVATLAGGMPAGRLTVAARAKRSARDNDNEDRRAFVHTLFSF